MSRQTEQRTRDLLASMSPAIPVEVTVEPPPLVVRAPLSTRRVPATFQVPPPVCETPALLLTSTPC